MASNVDFDITDFLNRTKGLGDKVGDATNKALFGVAGEIMRLSSFEVPHDKGLLQASGSIQPDGEDYIVGYNKVYAARLHEHPEYKFQKGRKAKYLEDPIKNNLSVFIKFIQDGVSSTLR